MSLLNVLLEHMFECLSMQIQNTCAGVIFLYLIHILVYEICSLSMYRLFVFQSLAESWSVSTNYLKQECLAMNGEWANFLEKKKS